MAGFSIAAIGRLGGERWRDMSSSQKQVGHVILHFLLSLFIDDLRPDRFITTRHVNLRSSPLTLIDALRQIGLSR